MVQKRKKYKNLEKNNFEDNIREAVDIALKEFGENTSEIIYSMLNRDYFIKKEEIPEKFVQFVQAIRSVFGGGSKTIEALILENLFAKLGPDSVEFQTITATMILVSPEFKQNLEPIQIQVTN
jgi:hypothetical protein